MQTREQKWFLRTREAKDVKTSQLCMQFQTRYQTGTLMNVICQIPMAIIIIITITIFTITTIIKGGRETEREIKVFAEIKRKLYFFL